MRISGVRCDHCSADLTTTTNCEGYYLVVGAANKLPAGGSQTLLSIRPPVEREHHFCSWMCLDAWRERQRRPRPAPAATSVAGDSVDAAYGWMTK